MVILLAVSSVILVGVNFPVKQLRLLLTIAVAEFSTTNGIPYVFHEKGLSSRKTAVAKGST